MNAGVECVLGVLRGSDRADHFSVEELQQAFALAKSEKVLPFFLKKLKESGVPLPEALRQQSSEAQREIATGTFWWTSELRGILEAFAAADVSVVLLKGPCLAERLYGDPSLRPSRDLDLPVRKSEAADAGKILRKLGFQPDEFGGEYHHEWRRSTTMLELHTNVSEVIDVQFDVDSAWRRVQPVVFAGQPAYVLAPSDELLFLCMHGVKHGYEQLSYVLDVALALQRFGPQAIGKQIYKDPILLDVLLLGHEMAKEMIPTSSITEALAQTRSLQKIRRVSAVLWKQLREPSGTKHPLATARGIYFALRPSFLAKLQYVWKVSVLLHEWDFEFAARFHIKNRLMVWGLRYIRLALNAVRYIAEYQGKAVRNESRTQSSIANVRLTRKS